MTDGALTEGMRLAGAVVTAGLGLWGLVRHDAAAGRAISVVVDRSTSPKNLAGVAFEALVGALLLAR